MPKRIYALAKELKLDSKLLVDICPKAGIQGKGSALASLSDEEVAKVRAYLDNASSRSAPRMPATSGRSLKTLPPARARAKAAAAPDSAVETPAGEAAAPPSPPEPAELPAEPAAAPAHEAAPEAPATPVPPLSAPAAPPESAPSPAANAPAPSTGAPTTVASARPPSAAKPHAGPSARPPIDVANRGRVASLDTKLRKRDADKKSGDKGGDESRLIRVAPMPEAKTPKSKPKSKEPAPQKPDIKLPVDAIRSVKSGGALTSRVRQQLEKKKKETDQPAKTTEPPRRGRGVADEDGKRGTLGREERKEKRKRRERRRQGSDEGSDQPERRIRKLKRTGRNTALPRKGNATLELPCTVRSFSEAVGLPKGPVLLKLRDLLDGALPNINSSLDAELAELLAGELGVEVDFKAAPDAEEELLNQYESQEDDPEQLAPRPPVITFLGHVDHGKTSLLDKIIGLNVVDGEAGGITQHIRAYCIKKDGRKIAFVDTPGHEAFTEMRARGANVTDVAVLVVAADDGIMPQTEEAISHARAADVPIVVALNKMDLPGVDVNRIMQDLAARELLPSEWGGETELIRCSAVTGDGLDDLLETLLTIAELHEYKANPHRHASGTCLEAERHEGRGVVAKMLVQNGTLKLGDCIVCGGAHGRVKAMYDTLKPARKHKEAPPSVPVNLTGLDEVPGAGDRFYVVDDIATAREIAEKRQTQNRERALAGSSPHISLEDLRLRLDEGGLIQDGVQTLNVIVRADTRGSIEAIEKEFTKLEHPEVAIKIIQALVGGVSEADVHLADASNAIIIGFNVVPDEGARALAKERGVEIRRYDIIYRVTEDIRAALEGLLKPEEQEKELGTALVQRVFSISRVGSIAGCRVIRGVIRREQQVRVRIIRDSTIIGDYPLDTLRREKDDAKEVREGLECGIKLAGFNDVKEGDFLEAYKIEEVARTL